MVIIKNNLKKSKDGALIDAGIHAREWLTHTTALYFIAHVLKDKHLLDMMDFYVIPCLNPDGYEFTHTSVGILFKYMFPICLIFFMFCFRNDCGAKI